MDECDTNKQLHEQNELLKRENELLKASVSEIEPLKAKIRELEARLAQYKNAHTPPSLRRGRNRKKDHDESNKGKPGQKIGHKGVTRPYVTPDRQVEP
jgi:septal ring factor EnvC (AmiA/AmiB activator)